MDLLPFILILFALTAFVGYQIRSSKEFENYPTNPKDRRPFWYGIYLRSFYASLLLGRLKPKEKRNKNLLIYYRIFSITGIILGFVLMLQNPR